MCHMCCVHLVTLIFCPWPWQTRVSDSRCLELKEQPPAQVQCVVSCDDDCVVSEWSQWSECPRICQNNMLPGSTIKQRTRTILAKASGQGRWPVAIDYKLCDVFHSYGNITIDVEALMAFEEGGIFIVLCLLWQGTSVFTILSKRLLHLVASLQ
jgi:hypothetical protein